MVNWDDQVALFELAFERYGAVDIVVRILLCYQVAERQLRFLSLDPERRYH